MVCHRHLLLGVGEACMNLGLQILPKHNILQRSYWCFRKSLGIHVRSEFSTVFLSSGVKFSLDSGWSLPPGRFLGSLQVIVSFVLTEMISGDDLELDLVFDSGVSQCEGGRLNTVGFFILLSVQIMWVEFSSCSGMVSSIYSLLLISFS